MTGGGARDSEPSLERRPVVCREMTSHHSSHELSCAERQRVITRATTRRVPRDDESSLERRHVVRRETTSRHSSDDRSSRSFSYRSVAIPGPLPGDRHTDGLPPLSWTPQLARVCAWRDPWQDGSEGSSQTNSRRTRPAAPLRSSCAEIG